MPHSSAKLNAFGRRLLIERVHAGWRIRAAAVAAGISRQRADVLLTRFHSEGARAFELRSDASALMSLARFEAAARLSIGGQTTAAFTLRTLAPAEGADPRIVSELVAASRERYGADRTKVDAQLERALEVRAADGDGPAGEADP